MNFLIRLAEWLIGKRGKVAVSIMRYSQLITIEDEVHRGTLTALSASERQWLRQLNSGQYKLIASSILESMAQPPPSLVPKDLTDAAREYVLYLSNCEISDEAKFSQAVHKMQMRFPQWKKRKLSLAVQLVINEK